MRQNTQELEYVLDQWALAWSSSDVEKLLPLFADSVDYEDVTLGAVSRGKNALRDRGLCGFRRSEVRVEITLRRGRRKIWSDRMGLARAANARLPRPTSDQ